MQTVVSSNAVNPLRQSQFAETFPSASQQPKPTRFWSTEWAFWIGLVASEWEMEATIFIGLPGSAKSSFYKERFFNSHVRISLALLKTRHCEDRLLQTCLETDQRFVIDNTNPSEIKGGAMSHFICTTCGAQFAETEQPPTECKICRDERQFVGWNGQQWTTLDDLRGSYRNVVRLKELGLYGIGMEPSFAIGQRALLVTHPEGNILWDCIPLLDEGLIEMVEGIGGISAIAISHPHYYTSMVEWSRAFDCPIYLHAADRQWVMRPDPAIELWEGQTKDIGNGLTLVRCGGHFGGGTVLHWPEGAGGKGAILSGDILQVVQDRRWVSFMYSYPNLIPLPASTVRRIAGAVEPFEFDRIYGAWWGKIVFGEAKAAVNRSVERYVQAIQD